MQEYLRILKDVVENGVLTNNRTGVSAYRTTGNMFTHDMRDGFPLLTTKKMGMKSIAAELEFFIKGLTDKRWLQERNCSIWNEWANPEKVPYSNDDVTKQKMLNESDLGEIYGYIWNHWEVPDKIIKILPKHVQKNDYNTRTKYPLFDIIQSQSNTVYNSVNYGKYHIVSDMYKINGKSCYDIQFLMTGYIKRGVRFDVIQKGNVKDVFYPHINNVAYLGNALIRTELDKNLYKTWSHMIDRCYNPKCKEYKLYGATGIFVDVRWHSFENFVKDASMLSGWVAKQRSPLLYEIDKDYYGSNCYSKDTCVWLSHMDNVLYRNSVPFEALSPDGDHTLHISQTRCANKFNLVSSKISSVLNGKRPHHKGYTFKYIYDGYLYRYALPINQLRNAINTLKTNPLDRRMIVMAWNPSKLHLQSLPPCHYSFQILSDGEYIDLIWQQRSVDTPLGLPYNIASYALLLTLIAKTVNMKPRKLIGFLADVHIYENQMEGIKEQITREPLPLCKLELLDTFTDIFEWKYDEFKLIGYNSHSSIKFPIAV